MTVLKPYSWNWRRSNAEDPYKKTDDGNIHGEHEVKSNLLGVGGEFFRSIFAADASMAVKFKGAILSFTMWGVSLFVTCIGALAGFIQAFVFCILTLSYISHLVADEH